MAGPIIFAGPFWRCASGTGAAVEVLTPDFLGDWQAVDCVLSAAPEVYNHNMETVPRLYKKVRGRADYQRSLDLLAYVKKSMPQTVTKSGLMLGLGETTEELLDVLADLRAVACDTLTLGQYLRRRSSIFRSSASCRLPNSMNWRCMARGLGFTHVASGPLVRSSYHADEMVHADADRGHSA